MVNILRSLRINRVAHVDKGAGKGVEILLTKRMEALEPEVEEYLKREFSDAERKDLASTGAAMPGGGYPIKTVADLENAIRAIGRAKDPAATKKHIISRAKALGASDKIPPTWTGVAKGADGSDMDVEEAMDVAALAFAKSVESILTDPAVVDKSALLHQSLDEFTNYHLDLVADAVLKASAATHSDREGGAMFTAELKKALGLPETATDAECAAAVTKAAADAAFGVNVAKMSDKHSAFMNNEKAKMPDGGKKAFAAMEPAERDAHMKSNPVDAEDAADGGADEATEKMLKALPESVRKQLADGQAAREAVAKLQDKADLADITKRFEAMPNVGAPADNAELVHKIGKLDPKLAEAVEKTLAGLNTVIAKGALFEELGSGRRGVTKAFDAIQAKAEELKKANPKWSIEKARTEARTQNPDLAKQEQAEARAA